MKNFLSFGMGCELCSLRSGLLPVRGRLCSLHYRLLPLRDDCIANIKTELDFPSSVSYNSDYSSVVAVSATTGSLF